MKWNCELIQDLLPLYEEGLCSASSRQAVEEHLRECDACRRLTAPLPIQEPEEGPAADRAVAKSMKKVKRRWLSSLIAVVLIVPLLLLSVNQFRGTGLCFTNIDDVVSARGYLSDLKDWDWEAVAASYAFDRDYDSIMEALSLPPEAYAKPFQSVTLGGEEWMASGLLIQAVSGPLEDSLFGLVYNRFNGFPLLTAELWDQVLATDPSAVIDLGDNRWEINGVAYALRATKWGALAAEESLLQGCVTAADLCGTFDLVPKAIYDEARPDLESNARSVYDATQSGYAHVASMSREEFVSYMRSKYVRELTELESIDFRLEDLSYHSCISYGDGGCAVVFTAQLRCALGQAPVHITIYTERGEFSHLSLSYTDRSDWIDTINRALYPSALPDY